MGNGFRIFSILIFSSIAISCAKKPAPATTSTNGTDSECAGISILTALKLAEPSHPFVQEAVKQAQKMIDPGIEAIPDLNSYAENSQSERVNLTFAIRGIPLCESHATMTRVHEQAVMMGKPPTGVQAASASDLEWDTEDAKPEMVMDALNLEGTPLNLHTKQCIALQGQKMVPAWKISFTVADFPYSGITANAGVIKAQQDFLTLADGASKVYQKDPEDSSNLVISSFKLPGMSGGGSLCHPHFVTQVPSGLSRAFNSGVQFVYDPTDKRFNETSVFTNAMTQAEWFMGLSASGGKWPGLQIVLNLIGTSDSYLNNTAVYFPATSSAQPTIRLGFGDGIDLTNLHYDADAVSHELGHHFVYQQLKTVTGESLIVHEGLADFFVAARTANACLGETICPHGGNLCISEKCLRTADNSLVLKGTDWPSAPHRQAQFISGMLWDLGKKIGLTAVANIVFRSVDFLTSDAGYVELVTALFMADKDLNASTNVCIIQTEAENRGLKAALAAKNVDCSSYKK